VLLLEEFGPEFLYSSGKHNLIADALSNLEVEPSESQDKPAIMARILTLMSLKMLKTLVKQLKRELLIRFLWICLILMKYKKMIKV
jgi:hypothetical protein